MTLPNFPVDFPAGIGAVVGDKFYYVKDKKKFRFISERAYNSWSLPLVVSTSEAALSQHKYVGRLGFRDGSAVRAVGSSSLYLIENGKRRSVNSPEWLNWLQLRERDFVKVSKEELDFHKEGEPLE